MIESHRDPTQRVGCRTAAHTANLHILIQQLVLRSAKSAITLFSGLEELREKIGISTTASFEILSALMRVSEEVRAFKQSTVSPFYRKNTGKNNLRTIGKRPANTELAERFVRL